MNNINPLAPIGIFDSGLGGLSILNEIHNRLPNENIIYLADSINAPYGEKSKEKIIDFSIDNTDFLLSKGCKIVVVACNTATTNAIDMLRNNFDLNFIGIEPAIKPASLNTQTNQIGVLATRGTLSSHLFSHKVKILREKVQITEVIGKGIVEAIENDKTDTVEFYENLSNQLQPFLAANIDYLVLGCSHYPFILDKIQKILKDKVQIIDSGFAVAKQTQRILKRNNLETANTRPNKNNIKIYTKGSSSKALVKILEKLNLEDRYKQIEI
mgnify:CR=1 FL=1